MRFPRASGWPEHEVEAILAARIAGQTDAQIRELVKALEASRPALLKQFLRPISDAASATVPRTILK